MGNIIIVSGKGFLKDIKKIENGIKGIRSPETNAFKVSFKPIWTKSAKEAKLFKKNGAINTIERFKLDAFMWHPWAQHKTEKKWDVVKRDPSYNFIHDEDHKVMEWVAIKALYDPDTDVRYLYNKKSTRVYYTEDEAKRLAKERNIEMLKELQSKVNKLKGIINEE